MTTRYRKLIQRGKKSTVVTTAIAREMAAFMSDITRRTMPDPSNAGTEQSVTNIIAQERERSVVEVVDHAGSRTLW